MVRKRQNNMKRGTSTGLVNLIKSPKSTVALRLSNSGFSRKNIETRSRVNLSDFHSPKSILSPPSHIKLRIKEDRVKASEMHDSEIESLEQAVTQSATEAEKLKKKLERFGALFYGLYDSIENGNNDTAKYVGLIKNELHYSQKRPLVLDIDKKKTEWQRTLKSPYVSAQAPSSKPIRRFNSSTSLRLQKKKVNLDSELNLIKLRLMFTLDKIAKKKAS